MNKIYINYSRADMKGLRKKAGIFTKELHKALIRLWNDAAKEFVRTVVVGGYVHVDTGMSASSLVPLAERLRIKTVIQRHIRMSPRKVEERKGQWLFEPYGEYKANLFRNEKEGIKAGQNAAKLLYGTVARPWMVFEFNIKVFQFLENEDEWQSLEAGMAAFNEYITSNTSRYVPAAFADKITPDFNE